MADVSNALGTLILPGATAMGMMQARHDKKKAEEMVIPSVDWRQQEVYDNLKDKARALETGAAYAPQQAALTQQGLSALNAATRTAGGGGGATASALANINRSTGRLMNELYGGMSQEGLQMQNLLSQTAKNMADRAYQIQGWEKSQALADAIKRKQQYQQGLTTALTDVYGGGLMDDLTGDNSNDINLSGALSGISQGASLGSVIPGLGTVAGGLIGGITGLFGWGNAGKKTEIDATKSIF